MSTIDAVRSLIAASHQPNGFNIGINVGEAAGQTIFHVHAHVIPRYTGDVADPRGGVRHVIPAKANYLVRRERSIVTGEDDPLLPHLLSNFTDARGLDIAVAFTLHSGIRLLHPYLRELLECGGRVRFLTGDYLGVTEPDALMRILDLQGNIASRIFETAQSGSSFHPKTYIFHYKSDYGIAFVGSSNLSETALKGGVEWDYKVVSSRDPQGFADVLGAFERLFNHPATRELNFDWINEYRSRRRTAGLPKIQTVEAAAVVEAGMEPAPPPVTPHVIQQEALAALQQTRRVGNKAGLVVLATGLGKTWLAAFDSERPEFRRILFVAHREEILAQALETFRRIHPAARLGNYDRNEKDLDAEVLFASIRTLGKSNHLQRFEPTAFDYIVIDEFHHGYAPTYRRLIDHFEPKFLLGLTATPERTDGGDLLSLCQENLVYRCDLGEGIRRGWLCPFRYFGVPDGVDYRNIPWRSTRFDEEELTTAVATHARAENALDQYRKRAGKRTLAFCVSQRHADFMAQHFKKAGIRAASVHSGESSDPRAASLDRLRAEEGENKLDILFAVDMFNEGVDLPSLDGSTTAPIETIVTSDGAFEFLAVLVRSTYTARVIPDNDAAPRLPVTISDKNVEDLVIHVPREREITVRTSVEGIGPVPAYMLSLAGYTSVAGRSVRTGSVSVLVKPEPDGAFKIKVPEDERRIEVTMIPMGYELRSVTYGSEDVRRNPVRLTAAASTELRVVFATDPAVPFGSVRGHITGLGPSAGDLRIVLNGAATFARFESPVNADGSFALSRIPQGPYVPTLEGTTAGILTPSVIAVSGADIAGIVLDLRSKRTRRNQPTLDEPPTGTTLTDMSGIGGTRETANESAAVASLRTINTANTALITYLSLSGGKYGTLQDLIGAGLLDPSFNGVRSGFSFAMVSTGSDYAAAAIPIGGETGRYGFFSMPDAVVRYSPMEMLAPARRNGGSVQ